MKKGTERLNLHDGNTPYNPPEFYNFHDGKIFTGLTVVSWNLTDTGPDLGGLYIILGSHKLNIPCPDIIKEEHECVLVPEIEAGSVVIFSEALTHGTSEWKDTFKRRLLLFKYSPPQQSWGGDYPKIPADKNLLTKRQKMLFERPYFSNRNPL